MKICIVGAGSIGKKHIKNIRQICNKNEIKLAIHLLRSSKSNLSDDVKDLVDKEIFDFCDLDNNYDAIIIANPTFLHYNTIIQLKNHSKYFFVEKPVFESHEKNINKMELPIDNIYYVACPLRYTGIITEAKKILDVEKIYSVRVICSTYLPDWRPNVDYREVYSAKRSEGGGVSIDLIHEWDYITYLFGNPMEVKKISGKYSELEIDSDDIAIYIAQYHNLLIEMHLDYFGRIPQRYFEFYTKENVYRFDFINNRVYKNNEIFIQYKEDGNQKYLNEMSNFLEIVKGEKVSENDLLNALDVMNYANG